MTGTYSGNLASPNWTGSEQCVAQSDLWTKTTLQMPSKAIPLRLGDDTFCIPRKKGLAPEFFYQWEPVSVRNPSDNSRRCLGVVLSLEGDIARNTGMMRVGIRNGEVDIPFTEVPERVSKLIGNYCILDTDDVEAVETDLTRSHPPVALEQTSQASRMIDTGDNEPVLFTARGKTRAEGLSAITESADETRSYDAQERQSELQQMDGADSTEKFFMKKMNEQQQKFNTQLKDQHTNLLEAMTKLLDSKLAQLNCPAGEKTPQRQDTMTKQPMAENFAQDQFEKALASLNKREKEELVTKDLFLILQKLNEQESRPLDVDQPKTEWSESDVKNLAKLFHYVCFGKDSPEKPDEAFNHRLNTRVDKLWAAVQKIPSGDLEQLRSTIAAWLTNEKPEPATPQIPRSDSSQPRTFKRLVSTKLQPSLRAFSLKKLKSFVQEKEKLNAFDKNSKQLKMISKPFTIWHAVGLFGSEQGKACWRVVRMVVRFLVKHKFECPWMTGAERGVFGETPLHIALLFNDAGKDDRQFYDMFSELWEMCPKLHDAQYADALYEGENVLHLAVIRNSGYDVIEKILKSDKSKELLKQKAVGDFFKEPSLSYGYCNLLGEYPLFFAACSHQVEVFKHLVRHGANLEDTATETEHNLLHLLILTDSSMARRAANEEHERQLLEQYKSLAQLLKSEGKHEVLEHTCNADGYSPLMLAAAEGSVKMFVHLFDDEKVEEAWTYGELVCRKMYLDDVDVSLSRKAQDKLTDGTDKKERGSNSHTKADISILEILVLNKRKEIIASSQIDKLVEMKWEKYGCSIFHRKLGVTLFVTLAIYLLPMTKINTSLAWRISHTLSHAVTAFVAEYLCELRCSRSLVHRFIFRTWDKDQGENESKDPNAPKAELNARTLLSQFREDIIGWIDCKHLVARLLTVWSERAKSLYQFLKEADGGDLMLGSWWSVHGACSRALHICDRWVALGRLSLDLLLDWDAEQRAAEIVPLASRVLLAMFLLRICMQQLRPASGAANFAEGGAGVFGDFWSTAAGEAALSLLNNVEAALYSVMGLVSFASVASLTMVFQDCGSFVLMVFKVVSSDLPIFVAIYSIFLLVFAHAHFLASNQLHAGLGEGMDSMWRIFSAMLGTFPDDKAVEQLSLNQMLVTGISVANYFLVAVVLLNLLIAMLTSTYDENKKDAQQGWKLHRASVLVRIDRSMTEQQRTAPDKVFWQTSPEDPNKRFITFNVIKGPSKGPAGSPRDHGPAEASGH